LFSFDQGRALRDRLGARPSNCPRPPTREKIHDDKEWLGSLANLHGRLWSL
jgi:hypothetical protein